MKNDFDRLDKTIVFGWVLILVACLTVWAVLLWAVIEIVQWVTAK